MTFPVAVSYTHLTYKKYPGKVLVGVTNAKTGKTEYLDGKNLDDKATMLRATRCV